MATKATFEFEGNEYTLEYNRDSLRKMEGVGFEVNMLESKIMLGLSFLFYGALVKHHPRVNLNEANRILDGILDGGGYTVEDILTVLSEMYAEVFTQSETSGKKKMLTVVTS